MSLYRGYIVPSGMDPFGGKACSCQGPQGTATCNGKPNGIEYISGRGIFDYVILGEYTKDDGDIGSELSGGWSTDHTKFHDSDGCCCCSKIGIVQTYSERYRYLGNPTDEHPTPGSFWFVDKAIPYPLQKTTNPCVLGRRYITWRDAPGADELTPLINIRLKSITQNFWSCVVCLAGNEGPVTELVNPGDYEPDDVFPHGETKYTGMTVYGCVNWGHSIYWSKKDGKYIYKRWVAGNEQTHSVRNYVGVEPPVVEWQDPVLRHTFGQ